MDNRAMTLPNPSDPVVIIGAGLAGLTTAQTLRKADVPVVVLEARDRLGGRAHSSSEGFADGQHCDLGGELIADGYSEFSALCEEFGVALSDPTWLERTDVGANASPLEGYLSPGRIVVGGEPVSGARYERLAAELLNALTTTPPANHEPAAQWIRRARLSEDARRALDGIYRMPIQKEPFQMDMHYMTDAHVGSPRRVVGGTQKLAEALRRGLDVRLSTPARTVRQGNGRAEVELENGDVLSARAVVVAVAPLVLGTLGFDPPLSATRLAVLTGMQRALGGKVIAQYLEGDTVRSALSNAAYSDGAINTVWVSNPYVTSGPAVVTGFACGTGRVLLEDETKALEALDALVSSVVGGPVTRIHGLAKDWSTDPYSFAIGILPPYTTRAAQVSLLAAPERRVHFAGDYTDIDFCETLEGAVRSGIRAAEEVLAHPSRRSVQETDRELVRS